MTVRPVPNCETRNGCCAGPTVSEDRGAARALNVLRITGFAGPFLWRAPEELRIGFDGPWALRLRLRFHKRPRQELGFVLAKTDWLVFR